MSCTTQSQQPTQFTVSVGSLPEGWCGNPQQLAQAIADRLIIQIQNNLSSFVTGPNAPTSNVGPWLKNCLRWYVFDDAQGVYVPEVQSGIGTIKYFTTSGTFTVPDGVFLLRASAWGGGAGGTNASGVSGGGGGGGGFGVKLFSVTPGQAIAYTVGAGGANGAPGASGGATTFLTLIANGGAASASDGGDGGSVAGADFSVNGGAASYGIAAHGGLGGDAPHGGQGGRPSSAGTVAILNGKAPGGGGTGGTLSGNAAGSGATGGVLLEY